MMITMYINNNNNAIIINHNSNSSNNNNNSNGQLKDLILLWHVFSRTFVCPGPVTVATLIELQHLLSVQSPVNGVAHTSNTCDISTNFDHTQENI
jgi:hypothetical protein